MDLEQTHEAYKFVMWCTNEPRANTNSQDSPWPWLGGSHHLPLYSILCAWPWDQHPNIILFQDSQVGVLKFPKLGLPQLQGPIILCADPRSRWGPKKSSSLCREVFQLYVARHLHVRKLERLLTFCGQGSNCQFDS